MKGVIIQESGGPEKLEWSDKLIVPKLQDGEVLIKNEYIGINYIDTYFRTGLYPAPKPLITGKEAVGIIASSSIPAYPVGMRVGYILDHAYAEYTAVPHTHLLPIPDAVTPQTAAASLLQGLTALTFIREVPVRPNQTVLVLAAAGGVGQWLVQILKSELFGLEGVKVIAAAGTDEKVALAKRLGADYGLNYNAVPLDKGVKTLCDTTAGECKTAYGGPDIIFDGIGAATFKTDLDIIARKGTIVVYGNASGAVPPVNVLELGPKCVRLMRPVLFGYIQSKKERDVYINDLWDLLIQGKANVCIHKVYDLQDVASAHRDLEGRRTMGKLLLKV